MHVVGVCAVLTNHRGDVLLVRTAKVGWELPGGRVEDGEDLLGALARELHEEAGCVAAIERLAGVYAHVRQNLLLLVFRGTSSTAAPRPQPTEAKVLEAAWFSPADALRRVSHEHENEALADALSSAPSAIYRAY
jgi:ADP-ribose pyrophosphatase YjhB (NUDIX family)